MQKTTKARRARRWLLLAGGVVGVLILAVLVVFAWAASSTDDSTFARALMWRESDVDDQHRFPARRIPAGPRVSPLRAGGEADPVVGSGEGMDEFLRETDTLAFLVVHEDRVVSEHYFDGATRETLQTSFSAAKSFVSTLVGIAIDAGLIGSVEDPVTDYLPELAERDPRFREITLRALLTMSSGIRYEEGGFPSLGDDTYTYYGVNLRDLALNGTRIQQPPGLSWQYNNFHPLLLGLVLERTTGTSVSEFMARRLWQPLGAEADATWNLDSERSGGTADGSCPRTGCARRPAPSQPPARPPTTATDTSGGSTWIGRGVSMPWASTVSTFLRRSRRERGGRSFRSRLGRRQHHLVGDVPGRRGPARAPALTAGAERRPRNGVPV